MALPFDEKRMKTAIILFALASLFTLTVIFLVTYDLATSKAL